MNRPYQLSRDTPKALRDQKGVGDIFRNAVECLDCDTVVESRHRHDFQKCKCGSIAIDGGSWYTKLVYLGENVKFRDLTELFDDAKESL